MQQLKTRRHPSQPPAAVCPAPSAQRPAPSWPAWELIALAALMALAAAFRLYRLGALSLWEDEGFTALWTLKSIPEILKWCADDYGPPLYYLLMHFWVKLWPGEFGLRLPSAIFGVLTIPLIYLCGRSAHSGRAGLIAALLLAANPFHVRYSQEARFYALYFAAALLALYFTLELAKRPTPGRWIGWIVAAALMLYSHCTAGVYVLALSGLLWALRPGFRDPIWRGWIAAHVAVGALFLPWSVTLFQQTSRVLESYWPATPTLGSLVETGLRMFTIPFVGFGSRPEGSALLAAVLALPLLALAVWGILARQPHAAGRGAAGLLLFGLAPWAVLFVFSLTVRSIYIDRIFIPSLGALLVAGAIVIAGAAQARRARALAGLLALAFVSGCVALGIYYREFRKNEIREAMAYLIQHAQEGDAAAGVTWRFGPAAQYYLRDTDIPLVPQLYLFSAPGFDTAGLTPEEAAAKLRRANNLWVIEVDDPPSQDENLQTEQWLHTFMEPVAAKSFHTVRLVRYRPRVPAP